MNGAISPKTNTMTNSQFTKLLRRLANAMNRYGALLIEAEKEYERRYGINPSDEDNDMWIDRFHNSNGPCFEDITAETIDKERSEYGL